MPKNKEIISAGQQIFLDRARKHSHMVKLIRATIIILFLLVWEAATYLGLIDDFIFSSPSRVIKCSLGMIADGSLFLHVGVTLYETMISFSLVVIIGLIISLLLWSSHGLAEIADPYLVILNSLPKSALAPILIVWLGNNIKTIIVSGVSVAVFGSVLTLYHGFLETDYDKIRLIYSLGGTKKDVLIKVLIPGSVPLIISNMKVNIGLCLIGVIIGEFLAANKGLGYLIIYGSQVFKLDLVMISIVILCVISICMYQIISLLEKKYL